MKDIYNLTLEEIAFELSEGNVPIVKEQHFRCGCIYHYTFKPCNKFELDHFSHKSDCGCRGRIWNVLTCKYNN